ncbi:MAG TPA: ferredoxin [Coriobacteriia bacterium]|nr:ferredoxin [Coriobacteriia bacterium]
MLRTIVTIDPELCDGCGLCVEACHEGAIALVDGKAKLMRDDYCDGLGNCLPVCPTGAIAFEEREAAAFDEEAVKRHMEGKDQVANAPDHTSGGCPGARARSSETAPAEPTDDAAADSAPLPSELRQWPIQIKLVPTNAHYFDDADVLIAADCTAFSHGNFHADFMRGKITLIGCPKLDAVDYSEKLTAIFAQNDITSITVVRMEVPCCSGLESAVATAIGASGKSIPLQSVILPIS